MNKLHYPAIEIRHEPDGELIFFCASPPFEQEDVVKAVRNILKGSNNFSIRGVETSKTHIGFHNKIEIHRGYEKKP